MAENGMCVIDFHDEFGESRGWIQKKFSLHPHGILAFIDEIDLKGCDTIREVFDTSLVQYRSGFSRAPFPRVGKEDPQRVVTDFLYEVVKRGNDVWVNFFIKDVAANRWVLLDQGDHDKLAKIYTVPEYETVPGIDLAEPSVF